MRRWLRGDLDIVVFGDIFHRLLYDPTYKNAEDGEYVCDEEFIFSDDGDVVGGITMFVMTIE
jgi:hypothetical protein